METLYKLIANHADIQIEDIKQDSEIRDIIEDSLDRIELILALEDEFNIDISEQDIDKMITIGDMCAYLKANTKYEGEFECGGER